MYHTKLVSDALITETVAGRNLKDNVKEKGPTDGSDISRGRALFWANATRNESFHMLLANNVKISS
jgi:hypothetical protein